ncbi:IS5 family transposase [Komagataeibacter rhaeticus]|uniref:IS5 family transposase n=1 Tax=Komagataeibacter rhaeticus TaxID=215221 RepID=UPI00295E927F|nr:IS5 family transposase [Komagataeibacter rhaeticus]
MCKCCFKIPHMCCRKIPQHDWGIFNQHIWGDYNQHSQDVQWAKMEPLCLGKKTDRGRSGKDNRLFIEAILWIARTSGPWRDLPPYFGHWNSVYSRYSDWTKVGVFQKIFEAVSDDADMEYVMIDGTVVRVHRHDQGAKGGPEAR